MGGRGYGRVTSFALTRFSEKDTFGGPLAPIRARELPRIYGSVKISKLKMCTFSPVYFKSTYSH